MEKSVKKYFIALLAVICFVCLLAAACTKQYYTLTFSTSQGVNIVSDISSGSRIKEGYEVTFTLSVDESIQVEPEVKVNGEVISANDSGVYSFKIKADTVVEATVPGSVTVTFDRENNDWVDFRSVDGESLSTIDVMTGETVSFKMHISIYYGDSDFVITANYNNAKIVVNPDSNGVYSYEVPGTVSFTVGELVVDTPFIGREDGGSGTAADPFRIERPIDLYAMADLISSTSEQSKYNTAYYSLENDIDMQGERVFVIGDATSSGSVFAGNFDGNGHTISNYYITDAIIEQSEYQNAHLQYVGLFGYAVTNQSLQGTGIYNLHLKNISVSCDGAAFGSSVAVGGLLGYGIGVNVTNCSAEGTITVDGDNNYFAYAGGLIGLQSSYADTTRYYAVVQSCYTDVDIIAKSGYIYAAGGITSAMSPYDANTPAIILNCYSKGNIGNALRVGGIVGQMNAYGSVKNCYAEGIIEAAARLMVTDGAEQYSYAYAGGIAGYADYGTVISDSFFTGKTYAFAAEGSAYAYSDGIVGYGAPAGTDYIETENAVIINCWSSQASKYSQTAVNAFTDAFIQETIGWSNKDWSFSGNGAPSINQTVESKSFTVTLIAGSDAPVKFNVSDLYVPMAYWYSAEDGIAQYIDKGNGTRTFGYYFDEQLIQKVPAGYVPTDDVTLYADFADYNVVAGNYRLVLDSGVEAKFELTLDGKIDYSEGALSRLSEYVYNGDWLILYDTMFVSSVDSEYEVYSFKAELKDGILSIYDNTLYPAATPLLAVGIIDTFNFGVYYDANGSQYTFNSDGTGVIAEYVDTLVERNMTWELSGNNLIIKLNGVEMSGKVDSEGYVSEVNNNTLSRFDSLRGVWEKSVTSHKQYEFDGIDKWTYKYYGYDSNGKEVVIATDGGNYTLGSDGVVDLGNGTEITFKNGELTVNGISYYRQNSFVGKWLYAGFGEPVDVTFNGIGAEGYGTGVINYGTVLGSFDVKYESFVLNGSVYINVYYEYALFGQFAFNSADNTLNGTLFSAKESEMIENARLCLYDDFYGDWKSEELGTVRFNGLGYYNFAGSANYTPVRGTVTINGKSAGTYTLENGMLKGSFAYNGKTYHIEYNDTDDVVEVECEGETFTLVR